VNAQRTWTVLLLGGASGVGKTTIAYQLADLFGVSVLQVDDLQAALERLTTPQQQPELHFWRTNWDEFSAFSDKQLVEHFVSVAQGVFGPALEAVIGQHLEDDIPVIVEGDFVTPALGLMDAFDQEADRGRVRGLFLHDAEAQIAANFGGREGDSQEFRAHASWLNGEWLREECARLGVPNLSARPWNSAVERAVAALLTPPRRSG
jgi:2-phosphoglycerate kinase